MISLEDKIQREIAMRRSKKESPVLATWSHFVTDQEKNNESEDEIRRPNPDISGNKGIIERVSYRGVWKDHPIQTQSISIKKSIVMRERHPSIVIFLIENEMKFLFTKAITRNGEVQLTSSNLSLIEKSGRSMTHGLLSTWVLKQTPLSFKKFSRNLKNNNSCIQKVIFQKCQLSAYCLDPWLCI
jgi:hypothetical protein